MSIKDLLWYSYRQLKAKKLETFLIIFAVSLSVLVFDAILSPTYQNLYPVHENIDGFVVSIGSSIQNLGNELYNKSGLPLTRFNVPEDPLSLKLSLKLLEDIKRAVPGIDFYSSSGISGEILRGYSSNYTSGPVNYGAQGILGLTHLSPEAITGLGFKLESGSIFTKNDFLENRPYLVLGSELAEKLFPNENPIGKTIEVINKTSPTYIVLGVLEPYPVPEKRDFIKQNINSIAASSYAPISYTDTEVTYYSAQIYPKVPSLAVFSRVSSYLDKHHPGLFSANAIEASMSNFNKEFKRSYISLGFISAFVLLIACINIINLLFTRIAKQNKAIGLNLALGASKGIIFYQYLITSFIQGLTGSLFGVLFLWLISLTKISDTFRIVFNSQAVILGIAAGLIMSAVFGIYPALVASQTSPVEALRTE